MDIPSFLSTYGVPGGFTACVAWLFLTSRKFDSDRRAELREDIDREKAENAELRSELAAERSKIVALEERLRRCEQGDEE